MIFKHNSFFVLLIFGSMVCENSDGLANSAVYIIKNEGTSQCLTAGPVVKNTLAQINVLKQGTSVSKPCSNTSTLATTDFGQQWTVRISKEESSSKMYQVQIAMLNTQYEDPKFHARLRGEFISYFPKLMKLIEQPISLFGMPNEFIMVDPASGYCLTDEVGSNQTAFFPCLDEPSRNSSNLKRKLQIWNFALVNELNTLGREHRKLSKPPSYKWTDKDIKSMGKITPLFYK